MTDPLFLKGYVPLFPFLPSLSFSWSQLPPPPLRQGPASPFAQPRDPQGLGRVQERRRAGRYGGREGEAGC